MSKKVFIFTSSFFSLPVVEYFSNEKKFSITGICFLNDFFLKKNNIKQKLKNFIGKFVSKLDDNFYYKDPYTEDKKKIYNFRKNVNFFFWSKDNEEIIKKQIINQKTDIIIVAGFKILKESLFSLARELSLNIHPGILPQNKGSTPVKWSIYLRKKHTGISIHKLSKKVDSGEMIYLKKIRLSKSINCYEAETLINSNIADVLNNLFNKKKVKYKLIPEKNYDNFNKVKSFLNLNENFSTIEANLRALKPYTGLKYYYKDKLICIWEIEKIRKNTSELSGLVKERDSSGNLVVTCKDYYCKITKILNFGKITKSSKFSL